MRNNSETDEIPIQYEEETKCMKERLTRCLQLLKISDEGVHKTALHLVEKSINQRKPTQQGGWISALNAIAGSCLLNQRAFSQSELYDFLTIAVTTSLECRTKAIDKLIFRIYKDIMATYEGLEGKLKIAYPKFIVDVVAILAGGVDTSGRRTSIHNVEVYYQTRKSDVISSSYVPPSDAPITAATAKSMESIEGDVKIKMPISNK